MYWDRLSIPVLRSLLTRAYIRHLEASIDDPPEHIAIIQDGNRRYATYRGQAPETGHHAGAETTTQILRWCQEYRIQELTLYAFSIENFNRPAPEREALFDLIERKLHEFANADVVHQNGISIRGIGDLDRLPTRVREAIETAEAATAPYDQFVLNIALAYGGRSTLLRAARMLATQAADKRLDPDTIDVDTVDTVLYDRSIRDVDLIIRTGGTRRTSNFLPWHANGNEAAVYFCTSYWPSFSQTDFLRALRTYERREEAWHHTKTQRAIALLRGLGSQELPDARSVIQRFNSSRLSSRPQGTTEESE